MSLTNITKTAAGLTNIVKTVASLVNQIKRAIIGFLLKEDGFYLLQENGGKIILEELNLVTNLTKTNA